MFDIGFAELVIIGIVALLVIGPERLPSTIRTASLWINRIRRGFNDIKAEVQQELHNDGVMQDLKKTGEQLMHDSQGISQEIQDATTALKEGTSVLKESTAAIKKSTTAATQPLADIAKPEPAVQPEAPKNPE